MFGSSRPIIFWIDIQVSSWISMLFLRNCWPWFLLFYLFKLLLMHFSCWWYMLHSVVICSLGRLEHNNGEDMVYCIGNTEWLIYICLVVVYIHQIRHNVCLWDLDVMSVSRTSVPIPCDLIIPRCIFHGKKQLRTSWTTMA